MDLHRIFLLRKMNLYNLIISPFALKSCFNSENQKKKITHKILKLLFYNKMEPYSKHLKNIILQDFETLLICGDLFYATIFISLKKTGSHISNKPTISFFGCIAVFEEKQFPHILVYSFILDFSKMALFCYKTF